MTSLSQARISELPNLERLSSELARRVSGACVIHRCEPLARRTTLRVGGPADLLVEPSGEGDLAEVVRFCTETSLPMHVIGRGSNLLVKDGGIRGVVVTLTHPSFQHVAVQGNEIKCQAGARLKAVAQAARDHGLSGLEFLEGIPGSVGGALRMNAGAMGGCVFDLVKTVRLMDRSSRIYEVPAAEMNATYRCCEAMRSNIALGAVLKGLPAERAVVQKRMDDLNRKRWTSQPAAPSAGCIFKNPRELPAGKLIEELGLKGARIGGACVSVEHGNFIVNDGGATAAEVLQLIGMIRERAMASRAIQLETEVEIVGEDV